MSLAASMSQGKLNASNGIIYGRRSCSVPSMLEIVHPARFRAQFVTFAGRLSTAGYSNTILRAVSGYILIVLEMSPAAEWDILPQRSETTCTCLEAVPVIVRAHPSYAPFYCVQMPDECV